MSGDHEPCRAHEMRRDAQPDVALGQRLSHAENAPAFQHGRLAMDQSRCRRRRGGAKITLLEKNDPQATPGGVARDAYAVHAAADDRKIVVRHAQAL